MHIKTLDRNYYNEYRQNSRSIEGVLWNKRAYDSLKDEKCHQIRQIALRELAKHPPTCQRTNGITKAILFICLAELEQVLNTVVSSSLRDIVNTPGYKPKYLDYTSSLFVVIFPVSALSSKIRCPLCRSGCHHHEGVFHEFLNQTALVNSHIPFCHTHLLVT